MSGSDSASGDRGDDGNSDGDDDGGVEVEETDLPEEDSDAERDGGGSVLGLLAELVRALVSESVGEKLSRAEASYEAARSRLRTLGILALTFLVFALLAAVVWLLVGVVFLAERVPATVDPLVFGVGLVVGYALAIVAGLVYG